MSTSPTRMRYGRIDGVEVPVSRLIQGTLSIRRDAEAAAFELFDTAYELGCNAFDTAPVYGRGIPEALLGRWMSHRQLRSSVVVIDKGCHPAGDLPRLNPQALAHDINGSLERLESDYIDLYLLHRDDPAVPVDEVVSALNAELRRGRIRAYGASNWTHQRLALANAYAARATLVPFVASSPGLSLAEPLHTWRGCVSLQPERDREALAWYAAGRMPVLGWSPLAAGFFGGRFRRDNRAELSTPSEQQVLEFYGSDANFERLDRLRVLAAERARPLSELALAYVLSQPIEVYGVLGCRDRNEWLECLNALELQLSAEERRFLEVGSI